MTLPNQEKNADSDDKLMTIRPNSPRESTTALPISIKVSLFVLSVITLLQLAMICITWKETAVLKSRLDGMTSCCDGRAIRGKLHQSSASSLQDLTEAANKSDRTADEVEVLPDKLSTFGYDENNYANYKDHNGDDAVNKVDDDDSNADYEPAAYYLKRSRRRAKKKNRRSKKGKKPKIQKAFGIHVKSGDQQTSFRLPAKKLSGWTDFDVTNRGFETSSLRQNGVFQVQQSGYYYVYSQVTLTKTTAGYVTTEIGVGSAGNTKFSKCRFESASVNETVSCYAGGVVFLHQGNAVSLRVWPPNSPVLKRPEYTYFGAFLIGVA